MLLKRRRYLKEKLLIILLKNKRQRSENTRIKPRESFIKQE
jgi:hypothetical protein